MTLNKNASYDEVKEYATKLYNGNQQRVTSYLRGWFNKNFK